jgi:hypothetical protein
MRASTRVLILVAAWAAPAATLLPPGDALRVTLLTASWLLFPGLALVLRVSDRPHRPWENSPRRRLLRMAVLTGAVSLACTILVSQALVLADAFDSGRALVALALLTSASVLVPVRRGSAAQGTESPLRGHPGEAR